MLDFHNHLIPDVDDGARTIAMSIDAVRSMSAQGIKAIVTTPHLTASLLHRPVNLTSYLAKVENGWRTLQESVRLEFPELRLYRGFEIMMDVPSVGVGDPIFRLGGSRFVLIEFPLASIPPHSDSALFDLRMQGYEPIMAHPERYREIQETTEIEANWRRVGAHLQANAGSFLGAYGPAAKKTAWTLLERGSLSYVCSDFHAAGSCLSEAAFTAIEKRYGGEFAHLLFAENPERILRNESPLLVKPAAARRRFLGWLPFRNRP